MASRGGRIPSLRDFNPIVVGLVGMALIASATGATFLFGTLQIFKKQYSVSAVFQESGGLKVGRGVRMAGVEVGKVTGVTPDFAKGQVVVTFDVAKGVKLDGRAATAEIAISTFLGGQYIRLGGPPPSQPYLDELPASERRIPLDRTKTPYSVNAALASITETSSEIDTDAVNTIVRQVADATARNQGDIGGLLDGLEQLASVVSQRDADFRNLVAHSQELTGALATRDQQIGQLIDVADGLLGQLAQQRDQLSTLLGSSSSVVANLSDLLVGKRAAIEALLTELSGTATGLDARRDDLNTSLAWAGPTIAAFSQIGHDGSIGVAVDGLSPDAIGLLQGLLGPLGGG